MLIAVCSAALPARAATLIDFGNTSGQSNLGTTGPNGNIRTYSATVNGIVVNLQASAWSIVGGTVQNAFLGAYSNWGLGVTNRGEGGSSPGHAVDDSGRFDFVTLWFDQDVILTELGLKAVSSNDTDATILFGEAPVPFGGSLGLHNTPVSTLNSLLDGGFDSFGGRSSRTAEFNGGAVASNLWVVTPYFADHKTDVFKIKTALIDVPTTSAVPEPGTWLMLLIGFFATGAVMRRRTGAASARPAIA